MRCDAIKPTYTDHAAVCKRRATWKAKALNGVLHYCTQHKALRQVEGSIKLWAWERMPGEP